MASASAKPSASGRHTLTALALAARRQVGLEWAGSPPHQALLAYPKPEGFSASPRDMRPTDTEAGLRVLSGAFVFSGETVAPGPGSDPWNRPSPSRRFAVALHRFGWMRDLLAASPDGAAEGLRLLLEWRRTFGRWNVFAWEPAVLERRVFNWACTAKAVSARASDAESARIALDLARQARFLLGVDAGPARAAERATAAAVAGTALAGNAGEQLMRRGLKRLVRALPVSVPPDGAHASRSPQAALELLYDLRTLDDALSQRGLPPPDELMRAIDRLAGAVRFFTAADGRLVALQGGETTTRGYVAAARASDEAEHAEAPAARGGLQRMEAKALQLTADAAAPAAGPWSVTACAQPLAIEVLVGGRRLIVGGGWTPDAGAPQAMRLVDAASTASVGDSSCGEPLRGYAARVLGPRLTSAPAVEAKRHEAPNALWLEMAHDGWTRRFGLRHERRLYLDIAADELRGEDRFTPSGASAKDGAERRKFVPFMVRFHLYPGVQALVARDKKSVLLKVEGQDNGWWLRNDALEVAIEPSLYYEAGQARRSQQIVLRGQARLETGARVRWKLSQAARPEAQIDEPAAEA